MFSRFGWLSAGLSIAVLSPTNALASLSDRDLWRTQNRCGLNSVYVMLRLNHQQVSYDELLQQTRIGEMGTSMTDLKKSLLQYSVPCSVIQASPKELRDLPLPAIAHVRHSSTGHGHFVVICSAGTQSVRYLDGTTGSLTVEGMNTFLKRWDGHLLVRSQQDSLINYLLSAILLLGLGLLGQATYFNYRNRKRESDVDPDTAHECAAATIKVKPADHRKKRSLLSRSLPLARPLALAIAAMVCVQSQSRCRADELRNIVDSYREHDRSVSSFSVEYTQTASALGAAEDVVAYINLGHLPVTRESFTYKGDMRRYSLIHPNGGVYNHLLKREPDGTPSPERVDSSLLNATNGSTTYLLDGDAPPRPKGAPKSMQLGTIGLPGKQDMHDGNHYIQTYLRRILRSVPDVFEIDKLRHETSLVGLAENVQLNLRPDRESVGGAECAVVDWVIARENAGIDGKSYRLLHTIWCDPSVGYSIRQHTVSLNEKSNLLSRHTMSDFEEVIPAVWYPRHIITDKCGDPDKTPRAKLGVPLIRYELVVDTIKVNNISDEVFTPSIPAGTYMCDMRFIKDGSPINYVQPASADQLEQMIAQVVTDTPAEPFSRSFRVILVVNIIIFVIIVALYWRRSRLSIK